MCASSFHKAFFIPFFKEFRQEKHAFPGCFISCVTSLNVCLLSLLEVSEVLTDDN